MKKTLLTVALMFILTISGWAQSANYHPTHILLTFSEESSVFDELSKQSAVGIIQLDQKLKSSNTQELPFTQQFLKEFELDAIQQLSPRTDRKKTPDIGNSFRDRLFLGEVDNPEMLLQTIEQLKQLPGIEIAEPDYFMQGAGKEVTDFRSFAKASDVTPNDPYFSDYQWGLKNTGQTINGVAGVAGEDINITSAWDITTGSEEVILAVLDSGVPLSATDFSGRILNGYDFVNDDDDPSDDHGHGSSVSSIALAKGNNNAIIAGVNWNSKLLPVKILDDENSGLYSWWIDGIFFSIDKGANVMNVSVGGSGASSSLENAFQAAIDNGIHVIACMMNENNEVTYYPAAYSGVTAVGAINNRGLRAEPFAWGGGSNYGNHIDLVAPGDLIASIKYDTPNSGATFWSGTSQATPMVAGTVSLMLSIQPDLTPAQTRQILIQTARGDGNWDKYMGWGVLDTEAALIEAQNTTTGTEEEIKADTPFSTNLKQNYPNPFNPTTNITFELADASPVTLTVYDILGREVTRLLNNTNLSSGAHNISFDASELTSGFYIYRLQAGNFTQTRKMALIK